MSETTFDTLSTSEELQQCGLNETQSKGIARAINVALTGNMATKADIDLLRKDIEGLENRLKLWMFKALGTVAAVIVVVTKILDFIWDKIPI